MVSERSCQLCGRRLRPNCKAPMHRACGRRGYSANGACLRCGKIVSPRSRGYHTSSKCSELKPWNAGLTTETSLILKAVGDAQRGKPKPSSTAAMLARWADPEKRARLSESLSRGQRQRFSRAEEREANRARVTALIRAGKMSAYGRGSGGNGRPPTQSESEMLSRLEAEGFVANHVVTTGKDRPKGSPNSYKIDLAHPSKKIAIEIDGSSHRGREAADARKTFFLRSQGWTVLRFQVPFDFDEASRRCILLSRQR